MEKLKNSFIEVLSAILPMTVLILILSFVLAPFSAQMMISFFGGTVMMVIGLSLFLFGAEMSMMEVGSRVGNYIIIKRSLIILIVIGFAVGLFVTVAEPDLQILAGHVDTVSRGAVNRQLLIFIVGVGVGIFVVLALLRIVFQLKLIYMLLIGYIIVFILAFFANPEFVPIAFDSGGVTTGPMTVPFILSLSAGVTSAIRPNKSSNDGFGMVGLASLGPIMAVMILGVIFR